MKKWNRKWKIRLIEENNPEWKDLYNEIILCSWIPAFAGMTGGGSILPPQFSLAEAGAGMTR
jgi:hypothetical protein